MASAETEYKRRRRKIWAGGGTAAALLFLGGSYFFDTRIEDDLEARVPEALSAAGMPGVSAKFSGQNGTLTCDQPLADPTAAEQIASEVHGVNKIAIDDGCRTNTAATPDTTLPTESTVPSSEAAAVDYNTVGEALSGNPEFTRFSDRLADADLTADLNDAAAGPYTVFAPSADAMAAVPDAQLAVLDSQPELQNQVLGFHVVEGNIDLDQLTDGTVLTTVSGETITVSGDGENAKVNGAAIAGAPITTNNGLVYTIDQMLIPDGVDLTPRQTANAKATFSDGKIVLAGSVASDAERQALIDAAAAKVGAENVDDASLIVDEAAGLDAATASSVASLIDSMATNLVSGEAGYRDAALYVEGEYATDEANTAMTAAAEAVGATAKLTKVQIDQADADDIEAVLNAYVAKNPILFDPGSSQLSPASTAVIDKIAADLIKIGNLNIVVEGHTDSDGSADTNKALSESRAQVVAQELVKRGVPEASVTSVGFGEEQPVLVNGTEDKAASRRVVFQLTSAN